MYKTRRAHADEAFGDWAYRVGWVPIKAFIEEYVEMSRDRDLRRWVSALGEVYLGRRALLQ
jgi:hypothetical protein